MASPSQAGHTDRAVEFTFVDATPALLAASLQEGARHPERVEVSAVPEDDLTGSFPAAAHLRKAAALTREARDRLAPTGWRYFLRNLRRQARLNSWLARSQSELIKALRLVVELMPKLQASLRRLERRDQVVERFLQRLAFDDRRRQEEIEHLSTIGAERETWEAKQKHLERQLTRVTADSVAQGREIFALREALLKMRRLLPQPFPGCDEFYAQFATSFRGSEDLIRERQRVFLPRVREVTQALGNRTVLDLGCGRGEWLRLMTEEGLEAVGVESNAVFCADGRALGLTIVYADALDHLRQAPAAQFAVVTAFHLAEHLPFHVLIALIDEARRVLAPGGLVIFETPNPDNLIVSTRTFHLDPTHQRPLPREFMLFLFQARGFSSTEIMLLSPEPASERVAPGGSPALAERFNELVAGPRDYALLATKPADAPPRA